MLINILGTSVLSECPNHTWLFYVYLCYLPLIFILSIVPQSIELIFMGDVTLQMGAEVVKNLVTFALSV